MKKIFALLFLVMVSSCINSLEEPCAFPIVGTWAKVNSDGSVSEYVKFDSGKYSTYTTTGKLYYLDGKIWNSSESSYSRIYNFDYSAYGDQLHYGKYVNELSMSNGVLKIGQSEYVPLNAWEPNYGFTLTHDIPLSNSIATYSAASQDIVWNYEIKNLPEDYRLDVEENVDWIDVEVIDKSVKLHIDENLTLNERSAKLTLSHPAVALLTANLTQMMFGPMMSSSSTSLDYVGGQKEFTYTIENPREGLFVEVSCDADWIFDLVHTGNKVSFKVAENNDGSSRSTDIVLKYGAVTVKHKVNQSYSASQLVTTPSSTSCDYVGGQKEFTYTVENPREGLSVEVSCDADWISDLVHTGNKVSFKVAENNDGLPRTADIVLKYGAVIVKHKVNQDTPLLDLSSTGTANSYIVSKLGAYKIKTVRGNSSSSVGSVATASVLWESFGTSTTPSVGALIENVSYDDGYIGFQTASAFKKGNAVIAAKDASGNILWSWHIWLTDAPQGQVYYNNAGTMMDRNLGATSATPGDVGALGLFYQWGRKDPFLGSSSISSPTLAKSTITWPSVIKSNSSNGTIEYATKNPTTFITYNNSNYDWYYTGSEETDNTRWTTSDKAKSIYDPCPPGWRVPDGGSNGVWSKAVGSSSSFTCTYNNTNEGMNFSGKFGSAPTIWYPTSGCRRGGDGGLDNGGNGGYWSASPDTYYAYYLNFHYHSSVYVSFRRSRAWGESVRCIQE